MQYVQDYDGRYPAYYSEPYSWPGGRATNDELAWSLVVLPYLKNTQVLQCPSEPHGTSAFSNPFLPGYSDYFYNSNLNCGFDFPEILPSNPWSKSDFDVVAPTSVILIGDTGWGGAQSMANCFSPVANACPDAIPPAGATPGVNYGFPPGSAFKDKTDPSSTYYPVNNDEEALECRQIHSGGANYVFCDGHVKWAKPESLTYQIPSGSNITFKVNDR